MLETDNIIYRPGDALPYSNTLDVIDTYSDYNYHWRYYTRKS